MSVGTEWIVDASGCDPASLADLAKMQSLFARVIDELGLKPLNALWHQFPSPGGVTGLVLLSESHLACHTYPEFGTATFNLYCCSDRAEWPWRERLNEELGATGVAVARVSRAVAQRAASMA